MIKNIPTKELADLLQISGAFVSQIKSGHRKLPTKYCLQVSKAFDIPLHELRPDVYPKNNNQGSAA